MLVRVGRERGLLMKRLIILTVAACLVAALFVAVASAGGANPKDSPFVGAWESIDLDGSQQWLWIEHEGAGVYSLRYYDSMASACDGPPAILLGGGTIELNTFHQTGSAWCLGDPSWYLGDFPGDMVYDEATDTMSGDVTWHRSHAKWHQVVPR